MRYTGRTTMELDGETADAATLHAIASTLQRAFDRALVEFVQVQEVSVKSNDDGRTVAVKMVLETNGPTELDEIADQFTDTALSYLEHADDSDELVVVESALTPA